MKVKLNVETKGKISKDVKHYGSDPFFIKKAAESKAFLEKNGFPEAFMKTRR